MLRWRFEKLQARGIGLLGVETMGTSIVFVVSLIRVVADLYVKIYRSCRVARLVNYARMRA